LEEWAEGGEEAKIVFPLKTKKNFNTCSMAKRFIKSRFPCPSGNSYNLS